MLDAMMEFAHAYPNISEIRMSVVDRNASLIPIVPATRHAYSTSVAIRASEHVVIMRNAMSLIICPCAVAREI